MLYDFRSTSEQHPADFFSPPSRIKFKPYNVLRVGLHDHVSNIALLFAPDWFADAFIASFGFPCYIITQCGVFLFHISLCRTVFYISYEIL